MKHLEVAPDWIRRLIKFEPEDELSAHHGWQLPGSGLDCSCAGAQPWTSLLGQDFLDAIGAVLSFSRKMLRADNFDGYLIPLKQLMAGHFKME